MEQFYNPDIIQQMRREKDARIVSSDAVNGSKASIIGTESHLFLRNEAEIIAEQTRGCVEEVLSTNRTREEVRRNIVNDHRK